MILTKEVHIKAYGTNIPYLKKLGHTNVKKNDIIIVSISDLPKTSSQKIFAKCDICDCIKEIIYIKYNQSISYGNNTFACSNKCSQIKTKNGLLEKYGVENVFQLESTKTKIKSVNLERYGVESAIQNETILNKVKNTNLKKYGFESSFKNKEVQNKYKNNLLEKYGVENVFQLEDVKDKIKTTNLEIFGVEHNSQSQEIKDKKIKTLIKNHGVEHALQSEDIKNKHKETRIKNGNQIPDEQLSDWKIYKKIVAKITYKNKKTLFENWSGSDYYDNEYIRENFKLNNKSNNYPTIDHKISVLYGFINNIPAYIIGDISNLCVTKKIINSTKNSKTEKEFLNNPPS